MVKIQQIMVKIYPFLLKTLSKHKTLTLTKDHNSVMNSSKFVHNNRNLDLVNINVNAKFSQDPFIHSQNIKRKQNFDINQGP